MASSEPQGIRQRIQEPEKPQYVPASTGSNGAIPGEAAIVNESGNVRGGSATSPTGATAADGSLQPDYVLVFSRASKPEVTKALAVLSDAGYFVKLRKGSSDTVLVLVRAGPGLVAGTKSRAVAVQQTMPIFKLPGVVDSFPVQPDNLPDVLASNMRGVFSPQLTLSAAQLDAIESLYGGSTAAVFELCNFMLRALVYPAALGVPVYYLFGNYALSFCVALLIWGTLFVSYWRDYVERAKAQQDLAHATILASQRGKAGSRVELRKLLFIPFAAVLMVLYAVGLLAVLSLEIFCTQLYDGPMKGVVGLVPVGANVVASQIYNIVYSYAIDKFTQWEDYPTKEALEQTKAQRQFYLQALLGYLPILLSAYVYLPFGHLLIDALPQLRRSKIGYHVNLVSKFELKESRLLDQAIFFTLQTQIIALLLGALVPFAVFTVKKSILKKANSAGNNRFSVEQLRVPFDPSAHLQSVVLSFGYVMVLAPVWPLAGLTTLVGLYLRSKTSAYVLTHSARKPASPGATRDIGFWSDELQIILIASSIVAPTITFMFGYSNTYYDKKTSYVNVSWLAVLLVALVSENCTLILSHVASKVYRALDLPLQIQPAASGSSLPVIDAHQDSLWQATDVEQELRSVFLTQGPASSPVPVAAATKASN